MVLPRRERTSDSRIDRPDLSVQSVERHHKYWELRDRRDRLSRNKYSRTRWCVCVLRLCEWQHFVASLRRLVCDGLPKPATEWRNFSLGRYSRFLYKPPPWGYLSCGFQR